MEPAEPADPAESPPPSGAEPETWASTASAIAEGESCVSTYVASAKLLLVAAGERDRLAARDPTV
ncbi:hypothetical protein FK85_32075 [Halorubrum saccharovorum]|uniref:Uncharacterized protein n=1 Tax=Halorubrum saccharovorum TaxID=2248 RepID=A0A0F8AX00_9EURY|nr:hypothetical protein FK85_32075 [Halorubrum saccharovorum]